MARIGRQLSLGLMLVFAAAGALPPSSSTAAERRPATAPATRPAQVLEVSKRLIRQLADEDYDRREAARVELMGVRRADLPTLREAVRQSLPLEPSQLSVLRDIVCQVYLAGEPYPIDPDGAGFLGVLPPQLVQPEHRGLFALERGVAVVNRVQGFSSFRMLQNNDVLLSMTADGTRTALNDPQELVEAVKKVSPGQTIVFEVLRQGRILNVPVTLGARPRDLTPPEAFTGPRTDRADEFWEQSFAPLLAETEPSPIKPSDSPPSLGG